MDPNDSEDDDDQSQNKDSEDSEDEQPEEEEVNKKPAKPKPFLKRKTRAVKFQKLDWNKVKSKTDCWTKRSARNEDREKSSSRINKSQTVKNKQSKKNEQKPKPKNKSFNKIKSRIDTGIRKNERRLGSEESYQESYEYQNQFNIGEYANEESNIRRNQKGQFRNNQTNFPPTIDVRKYQIGQQHIQPTQNYEAYSSEEEVGDPNNENYEYSHAHQQYAENSRQFNQGNDYSQSEDEEDSQIQIGKPSFVHFVESPPKGPLSVDNLEALYEGIHPYTQTLDP